MIQTEMACSRGQRQSEQGQGAWIMSLEKKFQFPFELYPAQKKKPSTVTSKSDICGQPQLSKPKNHFWDTFL